ncbi:MAG: glycosyltransferase family 4 protein, partial [Deferribacteraceae bacterium]|nr:glycosyltransferase family 4 protein [Deferribacteraceae bacterium]
MMRVLMFGWEFPPYLAGGLGIACHDMAQALAQRGVKVKFIQPQRKGIGEIPLSGGLELRSASGTNVEQVRRSEQFRRFTGEVWEKNIEIYSIDSTLTPYATAQSYDEYMEELKRQGYGNVTKDTFTDKSSDTVNLNGGYGKNLMEEVYRYSLAAAAIAAEGDFDVIHVHDWMTYPAGIIAKMISGKPLVAHAHSMEHDRSGHKVNHTLAHIEWQGLSAADLVVAVSHFTKNIVMNSYLIPEHKIKVVHNAVTRSEAHKQYHIPDILRQEKRVLFMGRITYQKGPDYFVEAARLVLNKIPSARFVMAGTGDMMLGLVRRVGELRMGSKFNFTGFMGRR